MDDVQDLITVDIDDCIVKLDAFIGCIKAPTPSQTRRVERKKQNNNIEWLVQKSTLAHGILEDLKLHDATDPKDVTVYHKGLEDIFCLYREIHAALPPDGCTDELEKLGVALSNLCLDLDALENPASPRIAFKMIEKAIEKARGCFAVKVMQKLRVLLPADVYQKLNNAFLKADEVCTAVLEQARAATISDDKLEHETVKSATDKIADISSRYQGLLYLLETFECRPDVEPPVLEEIRECLEEAGSFVASALMTLNKISLEKEDCKSQLKKAWTTIHEQVNKLRAEMVRWAECQLCAPPDFCRETTGQLLSDAEKSLDRVGRLPSGPRMSIEARNGIVDLAKAFYEKLIDFRCKAEKMSGFRMDVFAPFWWPLVQVKLLAEQCGKKEDPCHAMKLDLAKLFEILDALKGKTVGVVSGQDPGAVYTASVARVEMDQTCHEPWQTVRDVVEKSISICSQDVQQPLAPLVKHCEAQLAFLHSDIAHQMDFEGLQRVSSEGLRKLKALATVTIANALARPPLPETDKQTLTSLGSQLRLLLSTEL